MSAGRSRFRTSRGWIKRDTATGRIMDRKADTQPDLMPLCRQPWAGP
jgi:hypothetical protein